MNRFTRKRFIESAAVQTWAEFALPFNISIVKEAGHQEGILWEVVVIDSGLSKNRRLYPAEVLKASASKFEDANVFIHSFKDDKNDHLPDEVRDAFPKGVAGNMVGYLTDVKFKEVEGKGALVAQFHVTDNKMRETFLALQKAGRSDKLGFSIDVEGMVSEAVVDGQKVQKVESIDRVYALDVVTFPAAGGRINRLIAGLKNQFSKETKTMNKFKEQLVKFVKSFQPSILEGITDLAALADEKLIGFVSSAVDTLSGKIAKMPESQKEMREALKDDLGKVLEALKAGNLEAAAQMLEKMMSVAGSVVASHKAEPSLAVEAAMKAMGTKTNTEPAAAAASAKESVSPKDFADLKGRQDKTDATLKEGRIREGAANLRAALAESKLPEPMRERISSEHKDEEISTAKAGEIVKEAADFMAKLSKTGDIKGLGYESDTSVGMTESDRVQKAVDMLVDPSLKGTKGYEKVAPFSGLREAYVHITGDRELSWNRRGMTPRMVEALTSDFPKLFGDSITRRLLKAFRAFPTQWSKIATVTEVNDFRTQRRIQWGHFADLAIVAEDAAFTSLANPTEREATYTPAKRGNKFSITREMVLADDLRKLRDIPRMLGVAAARTLDKFVFAILSGTVGGGAPNSDTIFTGGVPYTAPQGNLGTAALSSSALRARRIALSKQTDDSDVETLGLVPKWLVVPLDLGPTAEIILNSEKEPGGDLNDINDNFKVAEKVMVPQSYLGGAAGANDWYLVASKDIIDGIEVGFVGGQQEPEVLIQDDPRTGDVFTNERITYKVRHEYGGAMVDFRPHDGNIVA